MKAGFILAAVFITLCSQGYSQLKGFSIGPYIEVARPTGNLEETNKNGAGIGLNADIRLGKLGLTASAGYIHFSGRPVIANENAKAPAIDAIPIRAGVKYRLAPVLYAKLEGGVANYTGGNGSAVIISPGIGLRVLGLDLQAKYETWVNDGTRSFWGLKAGYNF